MDPYDCPNATPDITTFHEKNVYLHQVNATWRLAETEAVSELLKHSQISQTSQESIQKLALILSENLRHSTKSTGKAGIVQGLLQEFSLSSQEGIALMCLAEALLRVPDQATRDLLIRDKINQGNWKEHLVQS